MGFEVAYDPAKNISIVQTVQKYPVIYDPRKYPPVENKEEFEQAWSNVAKELQVSEGYVKGRWLNIRGCFKRYLKNKVRSRKTKDYYLAPYLYFMLPFMNLSSEFIKQLAHISANETKSHGMDIGEEIEVKLVDSDGEEESFIISTTSNNSEEGTSVCKEQNADWDFFSSLLPDVQRMSFQQKSKFKNALLTAVDMALYGEDL